MSEKLLYYNTVVQQYPVAGQVVLEKRCNGITVKNNGNTICVFQSDPLQPGESKWIGGNRGEIYQGRIDFSFELPAVVPAIIINQVIVTQKFYLNIEGFGE